MRTFLRYLAVFLAVVLVCCAALFLAGLIPQSALKAHLLESYEQLEREGLHYGVLYQGHPRSTLDQYSESRILTYSYHMNTGESPAAILENPGWEPIEQSDATVFDDAAQSVRADAPANQSYTRYWMGFRAVVRPLLLMMNYMDIRQLLQWTLLLLTGAVSLLLYRRTNSFWIALGFVFAISQLNPVAISACIQFSTCFIIALTGMLLALTLRFRRCPVPMLFFLLGAATQFFDFYTTPLLTFGLPMLALLARRQREADERFDLKSTARLAGKSFAAWLIAYVLMWLAKLALTSAFTGEAAFAEAFGRVGYWMSVPSSGGGLKLVFNALFSNLLNLADLVPLALEAALLIVYLVAVIRRKPEKRVFAENAIYLLIAAIPLVWIAASAKPALEHMYFQYRILGVSFFAGILFLVNTARKKSDSQPEEKP